MRRLSKLDIVGLTLRRDALVAWLIFFVALIISIRFDGFAHIAAFAAHHQAWHAGEFITAYLLAPFSITFIAMRCLSESHHELQLRRAAEATIDRLALHDPLTGLPNRRHAEQAIAAALRHAAENPVAILVADLNRYRSVNDLHGHAAGDHLLRETGERLVRAAGEDAIVGRLGSDEFVIVLRNAPTGEALVSRVHAISQVFAQPIVLGELSLHVGASMGVKLVEDASTSAMTALNQANAAMDRCKLRGTNGFAFFEPGMEDAAKHRAQVETELRSAIGNGMLVPFYQPLVDLASDEVVGFEVLARWRLEDGSLRSPADFVPIAEETGLVGDLFFALLRTSMAQISNWPAHYRYAFNLSPRQLGESWLVERILLVLMQNGIAPGRLELEITESAIVDDLGKVRGLINRLKTQGIVVTLDDFGTGYSSLRHLRELDFDNLKIDKSFVMDLDSNPASQTIVRSVTALAHGLGLRVCVEGIETPACLEIVRKFGCDIAQGYHFGRPAERAIEPAGASEPLRRRA